VSVSNNRLNTSSPSESRAQRVAFFCRGRGKGHVVPDIAIADEMLRLHANAEINWISYSTGAELLRNEGFSVVDLELPDDNPFIPTQLKSLEIVRRLQPDLVIAHEEFAAIAAAKICGVNTIDLVDFFLHPSHLWMQCLACCNEVIFLDDEGYFPAPPSLQDKIYYAGRFVRRLGCSPGETLQARSFLKLDPGTTLIVAYSGNWTEQQAPIADLLIPAFRSLPHSNKLLVWIAGKDFAPLSSSLARRDDVVIKSHDSNFDMWLAAADLVITKGTRKTALEVSYLNKPSVSLSYNLNRIDDIRVSMIRSNVQLGARDLTPQMLAVHILRQLSYKPSEPYGPDSYYPGLTNAARRLTDKLAAVGSTT
jgi:hypothetical protein